MELYIAGEGFTLPSGFVLKEMTILFSNREYKHFIFKKPENIILTAKDKRTIRYTTSYFNNLSFTEGDIPYNIIDDILSPYKNYTIYTYSNIFTSFLKKRLPTSVVINIQTLGFNLPKNLPKPNCFKNHNPRYCSLAKALNIRKVVEDQHNLIKQSTQCS